MKLIYSPQYEPWRTRFIVVHHFGSPASAPYCSAAHLSIDQIEALHAARFGMTFYSMIANPTTGRGWRIGYNGIIFPDHFIQTRAIGEETAAQIGYNARGVAVSFCLAGNFTRKPDGETVDVPTKFQLQCLRELRALFPQVSDENVVPHRKFALTECYGDGLSDTWASHVTSIDPLDIEKPKEVPKIGIVDDPPDAPRISRTLSALSDLLRKLNLLVAKVRLGSAAAPSCADMQLRDGRMEL